MLNLPETVRDWLRPNPAWYGLGAAVALTCLGIMAIDTAAHADLAGTQARWLAIAMLGMGLCLIPHPRLISYMAYPFFAICLTFLVYLIIPGAPRVPVVNGSTGWIDLGVMRVQPSEFAKIAFVLTLARYLRFRDSYRTLSGLIVPFLIMIPPIMLLLKQPDLGMSLLFPATLLVVLVAVGAKLRHLGGLIAIGLVLVAVNVALVFSVPASSHPFLKPHQVSRIKSMIGLHQGQANTLGDAYQQHQAMTLVGAGQLYGYGAEQSRVIVEFNRLPHDHNDMIYAVIVNRWGLFGAMALLGLYLLLVLSFVAVAAQNKDPFARVACVGFAAMIFSQVVINVGMNVGLLPITGLNLPFVSYGGSSLLSSFMMIGLLVNFASRRPRGLTRPSFEYDHAEALFQ